MLSWEKYDHPTCTVCQGKIWLNVNHVYVCKINKLEIQHIEILKYEYSNGCPHTASVHWVLAYITRFLSSQSTLEFFFMSAAGVMTMTIFDTCFNMWFHPQWTPTTQNAVANCKWPYGHFLAFKIVDHMGLCWSKRGMVCTISVFSKHGSIRNRKHDVN